MASTRFMHRQPLEMPGGWSGWWLSADNPFKGWLAVWWELDDWGHRRLPKRLHRFLLGRLCDRLDRRLWR